MHVRNKKAEFLYDFDWTIEVGLMLKGLTVKKLRKNPPSLIDVYGYVDQGEVFLRNLGGENVKCLLHKRQIKKIIGMYSKSNYILIPTEFYDIKGVFKIKLGVGTRSTKYDLREKIKLRDEKKFLE